MFFFKILNHRKWLRQLFLIYLNTYVISEVGKPLKNGQCVPEQDTSVKFCTQIVHDIVNTMSYVPPKIFDRSISYSLPNLVLLSRRGTHFGPTHPTIWVYGH